MRIGNKKYAQVIATLVNRVRLVAIMVLKTCGQCTYLGPIGCTTSKYEQKFGNASTPACEEFKRKV